MAYLISLKLRLTSSTKGFGLSSSSRPSFSMLASSLYANTVVRRPMIAAIWKLTLGSYLPTKKDAEIDPVKPPTEHQNQDQAYSYSEPSSGRRLDCTTISESTITSEKATDRLDMNRQTAARF